MGITDHTHGVEQTPGAVKDRDAWHTAVHGVVKGVRHKPIELSLESTIRGGIDNISTKILEGIHIHELRAVMDIQQNSFQSDCNERMCLINKFPRGQKWRDILP